MREHCLHGEITPEIIMRLKLDDSYRCPVFEEISSDHISALKHYGLTSLESFNNNSLKWCRKCLNYAPYNKEPKP